VSIKDAYENGRFGLSFELFPPKTPESEAMMWRTVDDLMASLVRARLTKKEAGLWTAAWRVVAKKR
jgi:5,10-methylenetetrahydrofolate reductase